jgi:hypothetical protein
MSVISRRFWNRLGTAGLVAAASVATLLVLAIALTFVSSQSSANREFQRETGKPCGFCHVPGNEPALNPEGKRYQDCGYSFCARAQPPPAAGGCPGGKITCAAWCDKYRENAQACKYTSPESCVHRHGSVSRCVDDISPSD